MKKVLCFGDSNTFGFCPKDGSRYPVNVRWTGILSSELKNDFEIIEAGANNRCAFSNNPCDKMLIGTYIIQEYIKLKPDVVILAVGINDVQKIYDNGEDKIYQGIKKLVKLIKDNNVSNIVLIAPSMLKQQVLNSAFSSLFDMKSIKKSELIPKIYEKVSKEENLYFIDLNKIAQTSDIDGLHYSKESHRKIANALACFLKSQKFD